MEYYIIPPFYALVFQGVCFLQIFTSIPNMHLCSSNKPATLPFHLILLYLPKRILFGDKEYKSRSSTMCNFLPVPSYIFMLRENYIPQQSYNLRLHLSPYMQDQVSHPYETTGKVIILYILIFIFLDIKLKDQIFCTNASRHSCS